MCSDFVLYVENSPNTLLINPKAKSMNYTAQIAKHLREVYFGGNWTSVNLKDKLSDVTWQQAITPVSSLNTIAILFNHLNYYVTAITKVLEGGPLDAKDKYSFAHPPINSQEDWEAILEKAWIDAERFARLIELIPDSQLEEDFTDGKYGSYHRNLFGVIEHIHYHLGQIAVVKKLLLENEGYK